MNRLYNKFCKINQKLEIANPILILVKICNLKRLLSMGSNAQWLSDVEYTLLNK